MSFEPQPGPDAAPPPDAPVVPPGLEAPPPAPVEAPRPAVAATPRPAAAPAPTVAAPSPRAASSRRDGGVVRLAVPAAVLAALLSCGGTAAILLATQPAALPAPTPAPSAALATPPAATVVTHVDGTDAIAAVAAATEPSVVTISRPSARFGDTGGSGIVVSADGLILTTAIAAPVDTTYDVLLPDQHQTTATVVASDATHGLVLLRANATGLKPARLGSGGPLAVGQTVIAIGSPLGQFTDTVTSGIVSSLDRSIDLRDPSTGARVALGGLIQTDAAINAGSSGGPLLDITGTVVGVIATSASDGQGIGFAIPISAARDLIARAEA